MPREDWWGGAGGGTVAHAAIACMLGDISEAMLTFAKVLPLDLQRIALVDFNNDCVGDSLLVCQSMFDQYRAELKKRQPRGGRTLPASPVYGWIPASP